MKRIILMVLVVLFMSTLVFGASIPLRAIWTPNTEVDMAGYNLYRTDGGRVKLNTTLIPHPPALPYLFSVTVADNSQGAVTFVLTAVDTSGNESLDSEVVNYPFDLRSPVAPAGFRVTP